MATKYKELTEFSLDGNIKVKLPKEIDDEYHREQIIREMQDKLQQVLQEIPLVVEQDELVELKEVEIKAEKIEL